MTTPAATPSGSSRSQTRGGICDNASPRQPHHATSPPPPVRKCGGVYDNACRHPLRLLTLANAWGYLRQRVTAPAPPRHVATTSRHSQVCLCQPALSASALSPERAKHCLTMAHIPHWTVTKPCPVSLVPQPYIPLPIPLLNAHKSSRTSSPHSVYAQA
jgi:hypothetical protein